MAIIGYNNLPPGNGSFDYGPLIAHWEHRRWESFHAQIVAATSSNNAGVLGNFPQEVEQEVELLKGQLASEKEWSAALEEEVQRLEKKITDLHKEITWRELEMGPPAQWRGSNYSPN